MRGPSEKTPPKYIISQTLYDSQKKKIINSERYPPYNFMGRVVLGTSSESDLVNLIINISLFYQMDLKRTIKTS